MEKIRTQLINSGFTQDQIEEIKTGFDEGLDITAYADKEFLAIQMRQIRLGLCDGLDLSPFQHLGAGILKQLRLALKNHVKIVPYINEGYDMEQLEAIREALEKKVDIVPYLDKRFRGICIREICLGLGHGLDVSYFNSLMYTAADMKRRRLALQEHPGLAACDGVSTESAGDDGSQTVRIVLAEENTAAYADLDGIVSLAEDYAGTDTVMEIQLNVTNLLTVEEVTLATGDVHFDGNVFVKGNVGSGAGIYATGDLLVGGFVESAHIETGGDIMIRQGMNASGEGEIHAGGDVNGYFFEAVRIHAGGNIHGDYFMNCDLIAQGRINVMGKKGSLVGGRACAEQGLRANRLGNQAGLATYVQLGTGERLHRQELDLNEAVRSVSGELEVLNHAHEEFMKKYQPQVRNTIELFLKVESAIYTKEQEMDELMEKKRRLEEEKRKAAAVSAVVETKLYEGVTFEIERVRWTNSKRLGSVRVKKSENKIVVFSNR